MVQRPRDTNPFEFVVVAGLRAAQLMRGSIPRVERAHKVVTTAQLEVVAGLVARIPADVDPAADAAAAAAIE
jgi:DNA-directed RNA polymerase subunit K/omega